MRIAFVAQPFDRLYPPVRESSVALWIYHVARRCAARGHSPIVFANHGGTWASRTTSHEGVEYVFTATLLDRAVNRALRVRSRFATRGQDQPAIPEFAQAWHHAGYAAAAGWSARQLECDVVHIMNYSQFVPVIRRLHPRCTIGLHMHCEWLTQLDPATVKPRLEQTDVTVGCSEYITRRIAERFPAVAARCATVPNGADAIAESRRPSADSNVVLYVGRLSPEKGVHDLIRAFHTVLHEIPEARLHLVGGPGSAPLEFLIGLSTEPHVMALRRFYEPHGHGGGDGYVTALQTEAGQELGRRIFFDGQVPHDDIAGHYERAAVLVNPSLSESFGMSLVEAMMHRIPVVATRIGGMPTIVDHDVTGLLVGPAEPEGLAAAICRILRNPSRGREMGEVGRRAALERFSWDRSTDLLLSHFETLVMGDRLRLGQPGSSLHADP